MFQVGIGDVMRVQTFFGDGHNIDALGQPVLVPPEELPEQALYPVALHCSADLAADRGAEAPRFSLRRQYKKNKIRCMVAFSAIIAP